MDGIAYTEIAPVEASRSVDEDARAFLQERLAYFGRAYALIGLAFFIAGHLAGAGLSADLWRGADTGAAWAVPAASGTYFGQWLACRRGALALTTLRAIDAATTTVAAAFHALTIFAAVPGELTGLSYSRALLLVTFGIVARAIVVPSSPRWTFLLGVLAIGLPNATSHAWYSTQDLTRVPASLHATWTLLWCLGGVVIATLASHITFGLRREVREARRLGQYTLLEKIGEGGMGTVYRASHALLRRPTAVKLLRTEHAGAERVHRFEREVQAMSQLTHPNTVAIFDYGRTPDGIFYYAMEYLEGLNLEAIVRRDGPQPPGRVAHILRQVAASLAEAHGIGFVHRDIKPSNILLVPERGGQSDVVKVVDFGLVREIEPDVVLTRAGRIAGTPAYMSPEAISSPEQVGAASDIYALGCVGYFLLTGQLVFEGRTAVEVCAQHLSALPVLPAERLGRPVPEALSAILMACLQKDAGRRPSARGVIDYLDGNIDVEPWTSDRTRAWWQALKRPAPAPV